MNKIGFLFLVVLFLVFNINGYTQTTDVNSLLCDTNAYTVYKLSFKDTLIIGCDKVFLMNYKTFSQMNKAYRFVSSDIFREYRLNYKQLNDVWQEHKELDSIHIAKLYSAVDTLKEGAATFISSVKTNVVKLEQEQSNASKSLAKAETEITMLEQSLKAERRRSAYHKALVGGGSLMAGIIIGLLLE